jgi:hypothetical protein
LNNSPIGFHEQKQHVNPGAKERHHQALTPLLRILLESSSVTPVQ